MKMIFSALLVLSSVTAFADMKTSSETFKSDVSAGKVLSLPGGVLQVLNPSLSLEAGESDAFFVADAHTAQVICGEVKKSLIDFQTAYLSGLHAPNRQMVSFESNGAMKVHAVRSNVTGYPVIYSVSCK